MMSTFNAEIIYILIESQYRDVRAHSNMLLHCQNKGQTLLECGRTVSHCAQHATPSHTSTHKLRALKSSEHHLLELAG